MKVETATPLESKCLMITVAESGLTTAECERAIEAFANQQGELERTQAKLCNYNDKDVKWVTQQLYEILGRYPEVFGDGLIGISQFVVVKFWDEFDVSKPMFLLQAIDYCRGEHARMTKYESIVNPCDKTEFSLQIFPEKLDYQEGNNGALYRFDPKHSVN